MSRLPEDWLTFFSKPLATVVLAGAVAICPIFLPPYAVPFGFSFFFAWVILCAAAVMADKPILWAALCIIPLALVSWDWLHAPANDEFGFYPWAPIALFLGIALTTAATGVLFILKMVARNGANGS